MGRVSFLLEAGLLLANGGLFGGASALNIIDKTEAPVSTVCSRPGVSQHVKLEYLHYRYSNLFIPLDGEPKAIEASAEFTEAKCAYVDSDTCLYDYCEANPYSVQLLGSDNSTICNLVYSADDTAAPKPRL